VSAFDSLLPAYFLPTRLEPGDGHFFEALAGNLISPARGLLVYSPVLVLAVARPATPEERLFAAVPVLHWIVISTFPHWWGGDCYGARFFTDVLPYFAWFLAPVLAVPRRRVAIALAVLSVLIHFRGATAVATHQWNDGPPTVDQDPRRLWDWADPPFLRGVRGQ
jgi:hypothetical protein